jgi:PAS domain S-box-containing protein
MERAKVTPQSWQYFAAIGGLAVLYFVSAHFNYSIVTTERLISPVWLPSGISLAALVLLGSVAAPGIWLGEFWFSLSTHIPGLVACGTATAITLQVLLATTLLQRTQFDPKLLRLRDVAGLVLLAAVLTTPVNALLRLVSLCLGGTYAWKQFFSLSGDYWIGDIVSILLMTPVILTWASSQSIDNHTQGTLRRQHQLIEIGLWLILLIGLSWFVLTMRSQTQLENYPQEYLLFPLVIWAALRFGQQGTSLASLVISAVALWGLIQGGSPFLSNTASVDRSVLFLQVFVSVVALTGLFLAATVAERQQAINSLDQANDQLQKLAQTLDQQVHDRTQHLQESERRFRQLAESNIFGVTFGDFQGQIHYINDYLLRMLGCEREELLSGQRTWASMTPTEFLHLDIQGGEELKQYGICTPYEKEFIRQDGQRVPVLIGAALLQEPYAAQSEIVALCVDLTQLKQTEAALRQSQSKVAALNQDLQQHINELQTLFEVIPIGIAITEDSACQQIKVNAALSQILGISPVSNTSFAPLSDQPQPSYRVLQPSQPIEQALPLQDAATQGLEVRGVELDVVRGDSTVVNLLSYASPIRNEQGHPRGAIGAFVDITDRKRAEADYAQLLASEQAARAEAEAAQRRLSTLFETSPVGLGYLDQDQRFVAINEALANINGLSPAQHLGRTVSELYSDSDPALVDTFQRLYDTGQPLIAPNFAMNVPGRSDRHPGYYNVYYLPDITPTGKVESVLIYMMDVSDRVRLEQRELFLANASTVLTSSLDYEGTLERLAALAVPQLADWCIVDVLAEDRSIQRIAIAHTDPLKVQWAWEIEQRYPTNPNWTQGVPQVLRTGQAEIYTHIPEEMLMAAAYNAEHLEVLRQVGFCSAMVLPLRVGEQTLGAISLVAAESGRRYNSSDLALAEELARRAAHALDNARLYRQAQDLNRAKDEFLAILSHELRSPLNGILGWAQMLQRGKLSEDTKARALETIKRNAKAQVQLIDDLLDISRIIRGKLRLEVRPIELSSIIEVAIDAMRPAVDAKEIQLQRMLDPSAGLVLGDPERLQQILWNLLSNAIKFTPKGGRVQVQLQRHQLNIEMIVSDTGKGISSDFLPFVFERFRQADSSITRTYGGLGLGLAIVRHLVELHGGTVQVSSPGEGQGATFIVRLPLLTVQPHLNSSSQTAIAASTAPLSETEPQLEGLRVLVVDDEIDARELIATLLQTAGAEVRAVASATEALSALAEFQPQVLISDIGMPGEDGYTLLQKVRALEPEQGGRIPAIALTAYAYEQDRQRALEVGFQAHVSKPIDPAALLAVLASLAPVAADNSHTVVDP